MKPSDLLCEDRSAVWMIYLFKVDQRKGRPQIRLINSANLLDFTLISYLAEYYTILKEQRNLINIFCIFNNYWVFMDIFSLD